MNKARRNRLDKAISIIQEQMQVIEDIASEEQEAVDRNELLTELGGEIVKEEVEANYTPLSLEELVNEPMPNRMNEEKDRERFTTTFSFSWEELEKKLAEVQAEKEKEGK